MDIVKDCIDLSWKFSKYNFGYIILVKWNLNIYYLKNVKIIVRLLLIEMNVIF